jgi:single-stranded-DNA-specific exonuclease
MVLARAGWHAGVIGIVAARLAETYWRPTILLTVDGEVAHGSARSIAALHLYESLRECSARLIGFGGHARAAGLRLQATEIEAFKEEFEAVAAKYLSADDLKAVMEVDGEVRLGDITKTLLDEFERLAPFGEGNREPILTAFGLDVSSGINRIGESGRHLAFWVRQNDAAFRSVAFGKGEMASKLAEVRKCSIAFVPRINRWRGEESIELDVRDIKFNESQGQGMPCP